MHSGRIYQSTKATMIIRYHVDLATMNAVVQPEVEDLNLRHHVFPGPMTAILREICCRCT